MTSIDKFSTLYFLVLALSYINTLPTKEGYPDDLPNTPIVQAAGETPQRPHREDVKTTAKHLKSALNASLAKLSHHIDKALESDYPLLGTGELAPCWCDVS